MSKKSFANKLSKLYKKILVILCNQVIKMIIREQYLKKLIDSKDTELIKVITGVRRSGKSTLLLMFKEYLLNNGIKEENIIHINFESAKYDDIKNYKDLYKYIQEKA